MPPALDEALLPTPVHDPGRSRLAVVHAFARFLEDQRLGWVVRGSGTAPAIRAGRALAIVVESSRIGELPRLIGRFCAAQGLRCIQAAQREWNAFDFALAWLDAGSRTLEVFKLELCGDYGRRGRRFIPADELIRERVRCEHDRNLFVLPPHLAFITQLLEEVHAQNLDPAAHAELCATWREASRACLAELLRFWDETSTGRVRFAIEARDLAALRNELPLLRAALRRRVRRSPRDLWREARRLAAQTRHPAGYWVAFLGPDGSGKSTIVQRVGEELESVFRTVHSYHLRPHWLSRRRGSDPVVDPHGSPARGRIASVAKLCLWWVDCNAGFVFDLYPRLVRAQLVLVDRHFSDLLVDPRRYRYAGSRRLASLFCGTTFWPQLFVLLDAPVEVIHARKVEVAREEVERQRRAYRQLLASFPSSHAVDATRAIDDIAAEVTDGILARLERRTAERLGTTPR
jgi:thymidylate kinase